MLPIRRNSLKHICSLVQYKKRGIVCYGPKSVWLYVNYNEPPQIHAPPNYQIMVRYTLDPQTGNNIKTYSIVPIQMHDPRQFPYGAIPG